VASLIPIASKLLNLPKEPQAPSEQAPQGQASPPYQPFAAAPQSPPFQPFAPQAPAAPLAIATASTSYAPQINSVLRTSGLALRPRVMSRDQVDDVTAKLEQLGVPGAEQVFGNYMATNGIAQMGWDPDDTDLYSPKSEQAHEADMRKSLASLMRSSWKRPAPVIFDQGLYAKYAKEKDGKIRARVYDKLVKEGLLKFSSTGPRLIFKGDDINMSVTESGFSGRRFKTERSSNDPISRALALVQGDAPDRRTVRIARDYGAFVKLRINPPTADELRVQTFTGSPAPTKLELRFPTR
jgi:hypothetical protein